MRVQSEPHAFYGGGPVPTRRLVPAVLVALTTLAAGCAAAADAARERPLSGLPVGTTIVIGGTTGEPPATTTTATSEPPSALPSRSPTNVPTEGFRKLRGAGVPELAARAYLNASQRAGEALPNCKMPPEVLAAVGAGESRNGTIGSFDEDGTSREPILGYAPVGDDTDGGELDGDKEKDWAVGPMQFTPATWADLQRDGNGDGFMDPSNFYDAALATTAYLCKLVGPFPDAYFIAVQWDQWDRQKGQLQKRVDQLRAQWDELKSQRQQLEEYLATNPTDTVNAAALARLPQPGPQPEYKEPDMPPGPAQLRAGVERYYGPAGEVRDDYRDDVEAAFRRIAAATGGAKATADDRLL